MKRKTNSEYHRSEMVDGIEIAVFTEKLESKCPNKEKLEFIFEICNSTSKQYDFTITQLYKIFSIIQKSLTEIIDTIIIPKLSTNTVELLIEPEDDCYRLVKEKDKLYNHQLSRLCKLYRKRGIECSHRTDGKSHYLTFSVDKYAVAC